MQANDFANGEMKRQAPNRSVYCLEILSKLNIAFPFPFQRRNRVHRFFPFPFSLERNWSRMMMVMRYCRTVIAVAVVVADYDHCPSAQLNEHATYIICAQCTQLHIEDQTAIICIAGYPREWIQRRRWRRKKWKEREKKKLVFIAQSLSGYIYKVVRSR